MSEKESRFENDGQEVPTHRTGLRASNTVATLTPREVLPLQGLGLPPLCTELEPFVTYDPVRKTDYEEAVANAQADNRLAGLPAYNVLPVDWPTAQETMGLPAAPSPLDVDRLTWCEEQIDGLLDRIAKYNIRAQHRI